MEDLCLDARTRVLASEAKPEYLDNPHLYLTALLILLWRGQQDFIQPRDLVQFSRIFRG